MVVSALADIDLDLRDATIDHQQTSVNALVAFGNLDVYVPEGVNLTIGGITIFGHRRERGRDSAPEAPTVHVRVVGCFGTVDVWRVPADMHGSYSDILRKMRKAQRKGAKKKTA